MLIFASNDKKELGKQADREDFLYGARKVQKGKPDSKIPFELVIVREPLYSSYGGWTLNNELPMSGTLGIIF